MQNLRRQVKNVAYNYSDAQKKAREATSNNPYGPTTTQMMEIADFMRDPQAFNEVMSILWKRINDSGRNWRHVYKSLVLLDFLIKCGNKKVTSLCRDNLYAIETLRDFQHVEEGRDQGMIVREKATQVVTLLKNESTTSSTAESTPHVSAHSQGTSSSYRQSVTTDLPRTSDEEERQLRLAMELSMQEQKRFEQQNEEYEIRLQQAIEDSKREAETAKKRLEQTTPPVFLSKPESTSNVDDLLSLNDIFTFQQPQTSVSNELLNVSMDPWRTPSPAFDSDPWNPSELPAWGTPMNIPQSTLNMSTVLPMHELSSYENTASLQNLPPPVPSTGPQQVTASSFLNMPNAGVDIDSLVGLNNIATTNPFLIEQRRTPTLNEIRGDIQQPVSSSTTNPFVL